MEDTIKKKEKYLKGAWKKAQENYDSTGKEQKIKDAKTNGRGPTPPQVLSTRMVVRPLRKGAKEQG